ncbi:MAG: hypothetical protein NTY51_09330 [Deltaproteobacteria bacterium]|nr:hypothetical protein [Deltaproteobacteria bacterium]
MNASHGFFAFTVGSASLPIIRLRENTHAQFLMTGTEARPTSIKISPYGRNDRIMD